MTRTENRLLFHHGTFAAVSPSGDITGARGPSPDGLFRRDARHLSRWQLTVDGSIPTVLVPASEGPVAVSVLTEEGNRTEPPRHTVFREQSVGAGSLVERIRLTSNRPGTETARLALTVDADFADQFELRSDHRWYDKPHAVRTRTALPDGVEFGYRRGEWYSRTEVTADPPPDAVEDTGSGARRLVWDLELPAHGSAELSLRVAAHPHGTEPTGAATGPHGGTGGTAAGEARPGHGSGAAAADDPALPGADSWPRLARAARRGLADLSGLLVPASGPDGERVQVPAAGVPWFLALFGRHALITSLFALPYRPELALATLTALAATQATATDPERNAQPGKIVHEVRHGELAHFGQVPYGSYYGAVDSTPLFLVLLGETVARTGDPEPARRLERHARAAVRWMFAYGGLADPGAGADAEAPGPGASGEGTADAGTVGYLRYRPHEGGLTHQSWKDSPDALCFADGERAEGVIAAAAAQGYAYAALRHTAGLAESVWGDEALARRTTAAADALRVRFQRDFWMAEQDFPALALDGAGRRVDALASDAGHLLWSGILSRAQGERVGRRLLEPDFFSGWGIRTLAAGQPAYHALSYHRGGVWPHDNALTALGLARYGMHEQARRVADGLAAASERDGGRLPEVIAGCGRDEHPEPVPYPHACSPQSWAAAAPLALLTALAAAPDPEHGTVAGASGAPGPAPDAVGRDAAPEAGASAGPAGQPPEVSSSASAPIAAHS